MTPQQFDEILAQTLEDYRLSRGEKRAMAEVLGDQNVDARQLAVYRSRAFDVAREKLLGPEAKAVIEWLEDVVKFLQPRTAEEDATWSEALFSPGDHCPQRIANLFDGAREKADVCVFTITDDRITDAIVEAHRRGVAVRVISDDDKSEDRGSDIDRLVSRGVPVRLDRSQYHMHHKFALFDDNKLITGSYNWTRGAAEYNEENFIITNDDKLAAAFSRQFEELWKELK